LILGVSPLSSSLLPTDLLSPLLAAAPNSVEVLVVTDDLFGGTEILTASRQIHASFTSAAAQGSIGGRVVEPSQTGIGAEVQSVAFAAGSWAQNALRMTARHNGDKGDEEAFYCVRRRG
jgi:hypothetical protein